MLRLLIKRLLYPILDPWTKLYFSKPRWYRYKELEVRVNPDVFFPHITISTKLLLEHLDGLELSGKSILELGAGCGIISLRCVQHKALVTASDISEASIQNITLNAAVTGLNPNIVRSDLFDEIDRRFDLIVINPPYYRKDPKTEAEKAWFCGANLEYFQKLGAQLSTHLLEDGRAIMILSQDCPLDDIRHTLESAGLTMTETHRWNRFLETNYLFDLK